MGKGFKIKGMDELRKKLTEMGSQEAAEELGARATRALGLRVLGQAIKRTPVGRYDSPVDFVTEDGKHVSFTPKRGKVGGTLRRGWTAKTHGEAAKDPRPNGAQSALEQMQFVKESEVRHEGKSFTMELINPVEYATYVEYGHRTVNGGWVEGRHMLENAVNDVQSVAQAVVDAEVERFLKEKGLK